MVEHPIVVIGGGIGGLSTAINLAIAGEKVFIFEKNTATGGKMGQVSQDGFRWDTGPSVITMRHVFEDLFQRAGKSFADYVELLPISPLTRCFYHDGTIINASADLRKMAAEISKLDERDVEGYLAYLAYAARIHRITGPVFIYDQPPTLRSFSRVPVHDWLKADPLRTMQRSIESFVHDPHLRQLLGRFATYVGGSPFEAPATLNVIAHVELTGGVWYPRGGIYTIAHAMTQLAQELGVEICTSTPVQQITLKNGAAVGVQLADGEHIPAKAVIANVDVTTVYHHLLSPDGQYRRRAQKLNTFEPSASGFIMLLGIEGTHPQLAHHNIFFSRDYPQEFQTILKDQALADDPTIYISITAKTDPNHAPPDHENWFILVNAPPLDSSGIDWQTTAPIYCTHILEQLAARGVDIRDKIRSEMVFTPVDLQTGTGAWRGALYGPSPNSRWTAFRRPHNRAQDVKGLYFAGGTTHPGGGVPMVTLSGKVAADMVLHDIK